MESQSVIKSCSYVVSNSTMVTIDNMAINNEIDNHLSSYTNSKLTWHCDYHFYDPNNKDLTIQYILLLDALNFCFWSHPTYNYADLASSLKRVVLDNPENISANSLASMTIDKLKVWLPEAPLVEQRLNAVHEIGNVLNKHFNGKASNLVLMAKNSAIELLTLITAYFPLFRDTSVYKGYPIYYYKRAQILVGDIWGAYNGKDIGYFHDIEKITCFADYRVPQLLRSLKIMNYNDHLSNLLDNNIELLPGSLEEQELRAATIIAVERMVERIKYHNIKFDGNPINSVYMDWMLWNRGEELDMKKELQNHHRTLTIFY